MFANSCKIILDEASWQQLDAALKRPAVDKPRLRALLQKPSVLE
jgi:uncharacterized protein (DUF1778 family)